MPESLSHSDVPPLEVLDRWVAGVPTADDAACMAAYVACHPEAASLVRSISGNEGADWPGAVKLRHRLLAVARPAGATDVASAGRAAASEPAPPMRRAFDVRRPGRGDRPAGSGAPRRWRWGAAAAAVLGGVALTTWTRIQARDGGETPARVYATTVGQQARVTLGDGTEVVLNAGSVLRVPRDLSRSRTIVVDGEALFTVTHQSGTPFVVEAGDARVTVLGTEFAVRRYPEDRRVRVVVADGRVSVRSAMHPGTRALVLGARMLVELSDSGDTDVTQDADVPALTEWTRGRLVFRATPLRQALPELERRYGLVIRLADTALAEQRLTATVTDDPAGDVLDGIARMLGVRYVRDGNVVTFFTPPSRPARTRVEQGFPTSSEVSHGR